MNPEYPVYVISKGRWESRLTVKALESRHIPYSLVIEPQEYEQYAAVVDPANILMLPFSNLGEGSIPARNWVWEHALASGAAKHWILDDNIRHFRRLYKNQRIRVLDGSTFRAIEDWADRFENIALAGMQYTMFAFVSGVLPPVRMNTRIYSCILIDNSLPYRWRGRYNEDTDLSLRALKDGWCTALFCAFLADKVATMRMTGGNTEELYLIQDGRLKMAQELQRRHPDVTKIAWKFGRWQHVVDYRPFKGNKLRYKPGVEIPQGVNNYGMVLRGPTD